MTNILACETATHACSSALYCQDQMTQEYALAPRQHSQLLLTQVDQLLDQSACSLAEVDVFAFGCGPGSFMGLRLSASVIQAFAYANKKPVVAISSLRALAQSAYDQHQYEQVCVAWDARMGEVYYGEYQVEEGIMQVQTDDCLISPLTLKEKEKANPNRIGNAFKEYLDSEPSANLYPEAQSVAKLALYEYQKGNVLDAASALPNYVRMKVARKKKE